MAGPHARQRRRRCQPAAVQRGRPARQRRLPAPPRAPAARWALHTTASPAVDSTPHAVPTSSCPSRPALPPPLALPLVVPAPQLKRADVPLELEEIGLPMNTFGPKNPFIGKIVSVETITGPKATGETCHIIIQVGGPGLSSLFLSFGGELEEPGVWGWGVVQGVVQGARRRPRAAPGARESAWCRQQGLGCAEQQARAQPRAQAAGGRHAAARDGSARPGVWPRRADLAHADLAHAGLSCLQTDKKIPFVEGQSYGVIPPGTKVGPGGWGLTPGA